ncbi:hypothetical protein [Methylobacterium sp. E-045]|uniref:hypothetical protein n=1 Tax=Methylobacterium sp. E-045 TaxID=2836575 RepID=UPI001FBA3700|nr:hypothetical protein [Methylobacterium sp. E-045]MCJ2128002.1 hypothetical protein [Methylobacterium sp. E-045]
MPVTWTRTYPDSPRKHDFVAHDNGELVSRIYRMGDGPQDGRWLWFANGIQAAPGNVGCALNGEAPTKQEAADAVKAAWARWSEVRASDAKKPGAP